MNKLKQLFERTDSHYSVMQIVRWLWRAWHGNHLQAVLNAAIGLLGVVVSLSSVAAVKHAIDVASGSNDGSLTFAILVMAALILCDFALNISSVWVRNILGIKAQNRMQQRILDRLLRSEWHGKEERHSGDVLNRVEFDVNNVVNFLTETIPNAISILAMFFGAFFYLFLMDKWLAVIIIIMVPVFAIGSKFYIRKMRFYTRQVRDSDSQVQSVLQETIQHRMLIKTLEGTDEILHRLDNSQSTLRRNVVKRTSWSVVSNFILNFGFATGYLIAFAWAAVRMSQQTLSFGGMTAFLQLVNRIQNPARNLTKLVPAFVSVLTAAERLMELEENPLEEQGDPIAIGAPCGLRFDSVNYAYIDGDRNVIDHLTFDFAPTTCTAVLGETGAGKTTLIRMMLALLQPQHGDIYIYNKVESRKMSPLMRCNFVYVPQGNTLMSGTIRDNLLMGRLDATEEQMQKALHTACADFVDELPLGLDTICAEQGGGLSEGQAQRIAIARALLRNRPIMLLDEATSALDSETERQLLKNILADKSKTVIFITHRLSVLDYCDQTLQLKRTHNTSISSE